MSFQDSGQGQTPLGKAGEGLQALVSVQQLGVQAVNAIVAALKAVFPQGTGTSSSATAGAATLPPNPVGFINVTLPDGSQARVPYYDP